MIAFYVSGHGYGHATRSAAVMRALHRLRPDWRIAVRTSAPAMLFNRGVAYIQTAVEGAIVETADALAVNVAESARSLGEFLAQVDEFFAKEEDFVKTSGTSLIVADIPFLAGEVARRTGVPAIAIGNFLWHWVLADGISEELRAAIRHGYSGFSLALRLPFSHTGEWDVFPEVLDVPLVTPRSERPRKEIRRELGLTRPAILLGGRGRLTGERLDRVRRESPEFHFLLPEDAPVYSDLLRAADGVASKIGYSISAECAAEGKRLLYPPRTGFREEEILRRELPKYTPALAIPQEEWEAGNWRPWLRQLFGMPRPSIAIAADGAEVCARRIAAYHSR